MNQTSAVTIVTPGLGDLDDLVTLWGELVSDQQSFGTRILVEENESNARSWLATRLTFDGIRAARTDEDLVGFVTFELMRDQFLRSGQDGVVHNLYVSPAYRNREIGRQLLEHAERILKDRGADHVRLEVLEGNERALSFYENMGYHPYRVTLRKRLPETDNHNSREQ